MTELLENAVNRLKQYPPDVQDRITQSLLHLAIDPDFGMLVTADLEGYGLTESDHTEAQQEMGV
jgi:hypothetical protein